MSAPTTIGGKVMLYHAMAVTLAAAALAPGLKAPGRTPQVLRLRDATTGQEISLVGTVHYNPASVARAKDEVSSALDRSTVGAVVVESCTSRWGRSLELAPQQSWLGLHVRRLAQRFVVLTKPLEVDADGSANCHGC